LLWVVGGHGFLGSHLQRALPKYFPQGQLWSPTSMRLSWTDPQRLVDELRYYTTAFLGTARSSGRRWMLLWCAGIGVPNSSVADLEPEWYAWTEVLNLLRQHSASRQPLLPGVIFLASSAGSIYCESNAAILTEQTVPLPASDYGRHKLRMEQALLACAETMPHLSCLIGRISTLYGPGQNLRKLQGIISHISRRIIHHQPVHIYVPLDTRRDYIFADDCAQQIAAGLSRIAHKPQQPVVKIFASEESISVARILGIFLRLAKRRPLIVLSQPKGGPRPASLRFRSDVWPDLAAVQKTDLAAGIHMTHEYQMFAYGRGHLRRM
jgi:UDP-glucose 4-epimerase